MADNGQDSPMPDRLPDEGEPADTLEIEGTAPPASADAPAQVQTPSLQSSPPRIRPDRAGQNSAESDSTGWGTASNATDTTSTSASSDSSAEVRPPSYSAWFPIDEDPSVAPPSQIARIIAAGESSALDEAYWNSKFTQLDDPGYAVNEQGKIKWTIRPYNGTRQDPKMEYVYCSPPVRIGGCFWRLKLFPKGLEGPYLSINLECKKDGELQGENRSCPDTATSKSGVSQSTTPSHPSQLPWRIPAQFEVVIFNPQEPRVHIHKGSSQSFSASSHCCSFKRFTSVSVRELGLRHPHQRQALLRNDSLGVVAYIRTFRDETNCLFLRPSEPWDNLAITGYRGIAGDPSVHRHNQSLLAAVTTWIFLPPMQRLLTKALEIVRTEPVLPLLPLTASLDVLQERMKHPRSSSDSVSELVLIESALLWHAVCIPDTADVFEVWDILRGILLEELSTLSSVTAKQELLQLGFSRTPLPTHEAKSIKDVQGLVSSERLGASTWSGLNGSWNPACATSRPSALHIQLPRQRFDTEKRKWKKSKKAFDLTENISDPAPCTLQAIILHEDNDIRSRLFTTIVRADGQNFYKYGPDYRRVARLTRQQALVETKASAYSAVYAIDHEDEDESGAATIATLDEAEQAPDDRVRNPEAQKHTVTFLHSDDFRNSPQPGVFDQYDLCPKSALRVRIIPSEGILDLKQTIEAHFLGQEDEGKICYIWKLEKTFSRFSPRLKAAILDPSSLSAPSSGSGLYWVHVSERCKLERAPLAASERRPAISGDDAAFSDDERSEDEYSEEEESQDASAANMEPSSGVDDSEDTTMADAVVEAERGRIETPDPDTELGTHVFVKYFDPKAQTLQGVCNYIENRELPAQLSIRQHAPTLFKSAMDYTFYQELVPNVETRNSESKVVLCPGYAERQTKFEWKIFIVQPQLSKAEKDEIATCGGIVELAHFLKFFYLQHSRSLETVAGQQGSNQNYFGSPWFEGSLSRGSPHGQGKEVTLSGEEYVGSFRMGLRSGKGLLRLPNNNTYEGDFWEGHPHGTGKHVESITGNIYTGGFARGKKRGRGTTEWAQAEEETKVCRICFDNEQDSAFYPCGHVCACFECAKLTKECPMCHRDGSRPFKLYFAS